MKKLLSIMLIGAVLSIVPLIAGCEEPNEIRTEKKVEVKDQKVEQRTVVE